MSALRNVQPSAAIINSFPEWFSPNRSSLFSFAYSGSHYTILSLKTIPQYEYLTDDEIMNLAEQMEDLTAEAKSALQVELLRRNITPDMVRS